MEKIKNKIYKKELYTTPQSSGITCFTVFLVSFFIVIIFWEGLVWFGFFVCLVEVFCLMFCGVFFARKE